MRLTEGLYQKYSLKRVFFSAYMPVAEDSLLPALDTKPPLLREHRLYQADWLLRFYRLCSLRDRSTSAHPDFNPLLGPQMQLGASITCICSLWTVKPLFRTKCCCACRASA